MTTAPLRVLVSLAPVFLMVGVSTGCGPASPVCKSSDTFTWRGTSRAEVADANAAALSCAIQGAASADGASGLVVRLDWMYDAVENHHRQSILVNLGAAQVGTFQIVGGSNTTATQATVYFDSEKTLAAGEIDEFCEATSGTVVITRLDAVGGLVEGTIDVQSTNDFVKKNCPQTAAGTFSVTRVE